MASLRNFFKAYKKSLDAFKDGMRKAVFVFEKEVIQPQQKRVKEPAKSAFSVTNMLTMSKKKEADESVSMVDTLGSCFFNCKLSLEEVLKMLDQVGTQIQKECVEGIEVHERHYLSQNKNLLKRAEEFQGRLNKEKQSLY